jgi:hypothetical protein
MRLEDGDEGEGYLMIARREEKGRINAALFQVCY